MRGFIWEISDLVIFGLILYVVYRLLKVVARKLKEVMDRWEGLTKKEEKKK